MQAVQYSLPAFLIYPGQAYAPGKRQTCAYDSLSFPRPGVRAWHATTVRLPSIPMGSVRHHKILSDILMLVSTTTRNRVPFFRDPTFAREVVETLYRVQALHPFLLFAFVIMPDHCHFLMHIPSPNSISNVMMRFKSGVSHSIGKGPLWQPRYHVRIPDSASAAKKYIHANPVAARLVENETDYPWSSASGRWDISSIDIQ